MQEQSSVFTKILSVFALAAVVAAASQHYNARPAKQAQGNVSNAQLNPSEEMRRVLAHMQQVPKATNTACGPKDIPRNMTFDCVGPRPYAVQIDHVKFTFADASLGGRDAVCVRQNHCSALEDLDKPLRDAFENLRRLAFHY